jgi:hypothetical protein
MNPMILLFALLGSVSGAIGLGGGRSRSRAAAQEPEPIATDDNLPGAEDRVDSLDGAPAQGGNGTASDVTAGTTAPGTGGQTVPGTGGTTTTGPVRVPTFQGGSTPNNALPDTSQPVVEGMSVAGGRVTTIDPGLKNIASLRILGKPAIGNVTVNPDNKLALVLTGTDYSGPLSFRYEATLDDGTTRIETVNLAVQPLQHKQGWATGENVYMLETDADGRLIVEHGDNHHKIHVSGSDRAFSAADIAAREGVSESAVTNAFLLARGYGTSPDTAVDATLGRLMWRSAVGSNPKQGSHWLLFERGYEYDFANIMPSSEVSEFELHPNYVGAFGAGDAPVIHGQQRLVGSPSKNFVFDGLEFRNGVSLLEASNVILNDVSLDGSTISVMGLNHRVGGFTLRNSTIHDAVKDAPLNGTWGTGDRVSGLFVRDVNGLLVEGTLMDRIGWGEGYSWDGNGSLPQTPNKMSQNVYIQHGVNDITFRDNISMRAASFGAQVRPGGLIEDNVFIDNNAGLNALGGEVASDGTQVGHFSLLMDNLVTSGGARDSYILGALTWGIEARGSHTLLDNIVTHLADPNNPAEFAAKAGNGHAVVPNARAYYDDTIVYNWIAKNFSAQALVNNADRNIDGLDPAVLRQATIQNFTAQLLGRSSATIDDLGQFLRAQVADGEVNAVEADNIIAWFQTAFGIAPEIRTEAETLRFVPSDLGDGVRWDSRINWTTGDLPGTVAGDSVDLAGNWVTFATRTSTIEDLHFGSGGRLNVTSGRLNVLGDTTTGAGGAEIDVRNAGQLWIDGYSGADRLDIDVMGGRFANTGVFRGNADLTASGGQTLLGVDNAVYAVTDGSRLEVVGGSEFTVIHPTDPTRSVKAAAARVGFDGQEGGISILGLADGGTLAFRAKDNDLGTIEEFRSGALGAAPNVRSGIDLGGGRLEIDLTELASGNEFTLIDVDELIGVFGNVNVTGLAGRAAELVIDYETDAVRLKLAAGAAGVKTTVIGAPGSVTAGYEELMAALTGGQGTYDDADPPADDEDYPFAA